MSGRSFSSATCFEHWRTVGRVGEGDLIVLFMACFESWDLEMGMDNCWRRTVRMYKRKVTMEKYLNELQSRAWYSQLKQGKGGGRQSQDTAPEDWINLMAWQHSSLRVWWEWDERQTILFVDVIVLPLPLFIYNNGSCWPAIFGFFLIHSTSWNFQFSSAKTATSIFTLQTQKYFDQASDLVQHLTKYLLFFPFDSMNSGSDLNKT